MLDGLRTSSTDQRRFLEFMRVECAGICAGDPAAVAFACMHECVRMCTHKGIVHVLIRSRYHRNFAVKSRDFSDREEATPSLDERMTCKKFYGDRTVSYHVNEIRYLAYLKKSSRKKNYNR